jgi:hypothetical protein
MSLCESWQTRHTIGCALRRAPTNARSMSTTSIIACIKRLFASTLCVVCFIAMSMLFVVVVLATAHKNDAHCLRSHTIAIHSYAFTSTSLTAANLPNVASIGEYVAHLHDSSLFMRALQCLCVNHGRPVIRLVVRCGVHQITHEACLPHRSLLASSGCLHRRFALFVSLRCRCFFCCICCA